MSEEKREVWYDRIMVSRKFKYWFWQINNNELEKRRMKSEMCSFREVIAKHSKVFSSYPERRYLVEEDIGLTGETLIRFKHYRIS